MRITKWTIGAVVGLTALATAASSRQLRMDPWNGSRSRAT